MAFANPASFGEASSPFAVAASSYLDRLGIRRELTFLQEELPVLATIIHNKVVVAAATYLYYFIELVNYILFY